MRSLPTRVIPAYSAYRLRKRSGGGRASVVGGEVNYLQSPAASEVVTGGKAPVSGWRRCRQPMAALMRVMSAINWVAVVVGIVLPDRASM